MTDPRQPGMPPSSDPLQQDLFMRINGRPRHRPKTVAVGGDEEAGSPLDISRAGRVLKQRWYWPAIAAIIIAAAAASWVASQPARFVSMATLQIVVPRQQMSPGLEGRESERTTVSEATIMSQLEIMRSRGVVGRLVDSVPDRLRIVTTGFSQDLVANAVIPASAKPLSVNLEFTAGGWRVAGGSSTLVPYGQTQLIGEITLALQKPPAEVTSGSLLLLDRESAIDRFLASVTVSPRENTSLIDLRVVTTSPLTALAGANGLARAYRDADVETSRGKLRRRRDFIEQQLSEVSEQLLRADGSQGAFRGRQQAYSAEDRFTTTRTEAEELNRSRNNLESERRLTLDVLRRLQSGSPDVRANGLRMIPSTPLNVNPNVVALSGQLLARETQRTELVSGPRGLAVTSPEVQRADTLVMNTKDQLVAAVSAHLDVLQTRIVTADSQIADVANRLRTVPAAQAQETQLELSASVLREQAEVLRRESQRVRIAEAAETGQVEIVDFATRANMASVPKIPVIAFAGFLGLLIGAAGVLLRDRFDGKIDGRTTVERRLGTNMIGMVPRIGPPPKAAGKAMKLLPSKAAKNSRQHVAFSSAADKRSISAESFRQILTNVLYVGVGSPIRTLLVTSPREGEGKTSVAVNLALAFANQRQRVLLVDTDLIRGSLSQLFGITASVGLHQVLTDDVSAHDVVVETEYPNIWLLPAGVSSQNADSSPGHLRFSNILRDLAADYDIAILDSAPMLAVSDSIALGVACDGVLMVIRPGKSEITEASEALRQLDVVGAHVVGVVLNDADGQLAWRDNYRYEYGRYAAK